jgi:hypothetical protein
VLKLKKKSVAKRLNSNLDLFSQTTQQKPCVYNITFRLIGVIIVVAEYQWILHNLSVCICNFSYPAWRAHVPCCHLLYARHCKCFSTFSHKWHEFRKNVTENKMYVLIFSTMFVWKISHSKKTWARYDQKCTLVFT